ncbi:MAG: hypothetical protein N4A74_05230 [Carboxylicivirga sp.]|jgi:hypothetical protein|nr:hypothetical protein [Carboxylicivirga sp.]
MKNTIKILLSLTALFIITITAHAVSHVELNTAVQFVKENGEALAMAPIIVSSKITPELIQQLKVKHGKLKIITVVVEAPVYDVDQLTQQDKANMRILNIDPDVVGNEKLSLERRLKPLENLTRFKDDKTKIEAAKSLTHLNGTVLEDGEQYQFLVKRPDKGLIKMLLPLAQDGKIDDFAEKAIKNLVVDGDMDELDDGIVFMGVVTKLKAMISPAKSFLSKA